MNADTKDCVEHLDADISAATCAIEGVIADELRRSKNPLAMVYALCDVACRVLPPTEQSTINFLDEAMQESIAMALAKQYQQGATHGAN